MSRLHTETAQYKLKVIHYGRRAGSANFLGRLKSKFEAWNNLKRMSVLLITRSQSYAGVPESGVPAYYRTYKYTSFNLYRFCDSAR